jgi:CheY-like chemotaxis protein
MTHSVLIVDASADNREVLRTALSRRGLRTLEAVGPADGLELAREHRPDVIVLDVEAEDRSENAICEQFAAEANDRNSTVIILGKVRRGVAFAGGHVIAKPYHFAPLVHTIEQLAAKAA